MKHLTLVAIGIMTIGSYAHATSYSRCEGSIKHVFTKNTTKGYFSKPVFEIDSKGKLIAASQMVEKYYSEEDQEYTFRYDDKNKVKKGDAEFSYKVEKDNQGRVISIEQTNCTNCNSKITFTHVGSNCIPEKVFTVDNEVQTLRADMNICKNIHEVKKKAQNASKKSVKCLAELKESQVEVRSVIKAFKSIEDQEGAQNSAFIQDFKSLDENLTQLEKIISANDEVSLSEMKYRAAIDGISSKCVENFGLLTINPSKGFVESSSGVYELGAKSTRSRRKSKSKKVRKSD